MNTRTFLQMLMVAGMVFISAAPAAPSSFCLAPRVFLVQPPVYVFSQAPRLADYLQHPELVGIQGNIFSDFRGRLLRFGVEYSADDDEWKLTFTDASEPDFYGIFRLFHDRTLSAYLRLGMNNADGKPGKRSQWYGHELFDLGMFFFGTRVHAFEVHWVKSLPDLLNVFNEGLRAGLSVEEAALRTKAGGYASSYGFTRVEYDPRQHWGEIPPFSSVTIRFLPRQVFLCEQGI
ncbi:MAG: hypothetical protein NC924_04770 [Candidatus Omnitrophica bacterium]|nr:hypothetical protein [Candidatus Omnitrophota bacterium]